MQKKTKKRIIDSKYKKIKLRGTGQNVDVLMEMRGSPVQIKYAVGLSYYAQHENNLLQL